MVIITLLTQDIK